MRDGSRVPPARSSLGTGDRSSDGALTVPTTGGQSSLPETATAPTDATLGQGEAAKPASSLPRRVRGTNGARSPARVERPVLPDSFVERFRAAAAASEAREADRENNGAGAHEAAKHRGAPPDPTTQGKPATASPSLPHRVRGTNGAPKPPAKVRRPFSAGMSNAGPPDDNTQPIPAVSGKPATEMPSATASSAAVAAADEEAAASPQDARAEESAGEKPVAVTAVPAEPTSPAPDRTGTKQAAAHRPAAATVIPAQRSAKHHASVKRAEPAAAKNRTGRAYRMAGLLVIVVALAVGVGSFVTLHHSGRSGHKALVPSAQIPLVIRNTAGVWVATQIAVGDVVACDPVMCQTLKAHGVADSRLRVQWPGSDNLSGCSVVVATPALQGQLGARLDSRYAPAIIARFGSGDQQIVVRAAAPHGAAAYRADLASDLADRKAAGASFASGLKSAQLSAAEKKELAAGQVDARLMVLVADLETRRQVRVETFGDASPGVATTTAPLRSADLVITSNAIKQSLLAALDNVVRHWPKYRPAHVDPVRLATGGLGLRIEFAAPSPLGFLNQ